MLQRSKPGERKERRGFASMTPEKQREIASKGGRAAHQKGTAHEWTSDEARSAGRKGGQISRGGRGRLVDDAVRAEPARAERDRRRAPTGGARRSAVDVIRRRRVRMCETGSDGGGRGAWLAPRRRRPRLPPTAAGSRPRSARRRRRQRPRATPAAAQPSSGEVETRPATTTIEWGYGAVVRADGRSAAGEEVVAERLPGELRSRPGLHRRVGLAGDVRRSAPAIAPRSSARGRWCAGSTATCGRCSWRPSRSPAGVVNEHPFVRQGWSDNQLGRPVAGREGQPDVAVAAAAGGVRAARA